MQCAVAILDGNRVISHAINLCAAPSRRILRRIEWSSRIILSIALPMHAQMHYSLRIDGQSRARNVTPAINLLKGKNIVGARPILAVTCCVIHDKVKLVIRRTPDGMNLSSHVDGYIGKPASSILRRQAKRRRPLACLAKEWRRKAKDQQQAKNQYAAAQAQNAASATVPTTPPPRICIHLRLVTAAEQLRYVHRSSRLVQQILASIPARPPDCSRRAHVRSGRIGYSRR